MKVVALIILLLSLSARSALAIDRPALAFVPIDDRPVTYELPRMLGDIAGVDVLTPPQPTLGRFLTPGDTDSIWAWLLSQRTNGAFAYVLSTDMLAYGGLIASRAPYTPDLVAQARLGRFVNLRVQRPDTPIFAFGTLMRLAPTGVAKIGAAADYFAAGSVSESIAEYARLPDPPQTAAQTERAAQLRAAIGEPLLQAYLATRARNLVVDTSVLSYLTAPRAIDRLILGQDDAGTVGLHLRDVAALRDAIERYGIGSVAAIESGTDELGMVLISAALAQRAQWSPTISVRYSRADGGTVQDPLELGPVDQTADSVIASSGARRVQGNADIDLFIRVTKTSDTDEAAFVDAIVNDVAAKHAVAVVDLTFLGGSNDEQKALVLALIARRAAASIDAFASWNTAANSLGTAIPEAIAAGVGRRKNTYDAAAHRRFLLDRYIDDYGYRLIVRDAVDADLAARGVADHSYLLPDDAQFAENDVRSRLEPLGFSLLQQTGIELRRPAILVRLPWPRTFEVWIDVLSSPR